MKSQKSSGLEETEEIEDIILTKSVTWDVEEWEQIDPKAWWFYIFPYDLTSLFDLLAEAVDVSGDQTDEDISPIHNVGDDIEYKVYVAAEFSVKGESNGNEGDWRDGGANNQVVPLLLPWVLAGDLEVVNTLLLIISTPF